MLLYCIVYITETSIIISINIISLILLLVQNFKLHVRFIRFFTIVIKISLNKYLSIFYIIIIVIIII